MVTILPRLPQGGVKMDKFWIEYEQKEWTAEVGGVSSGVEGISIGYETKKK